MHAVHLGRRELSWRVLADASGGSTQSVGAKISAHGTGKATRVTVEETGDRLG